MERKTMKQLILIILAVCVFTLPIMSQEVDACDEPITFTVWGQVVPQDSLTERLIKMGEGKITVAQFPSGKYDTVPISRQGLYSYEIHTCSQLIVQPHISGLYRFCERCADIYDPPNEWIDLNLEPYPIKRVDFGASIVYY